MYCSLANSGSGESAYLGKMPGQILKTATCIETASMGHHVDRRTADPLILKTGHRLLLDYRPPSTQANKTDNCGFKPFDQAGDPGKPFFEFAMTDFICPSRRSADKICKAYAVLR